MLGAIAPLVQAGAQGIVFQDDQPAMLFQALHNVRQGGEWVSPRLVDIVLAQAEQSEALRSISRHVLNLVPKVATMGGHIPASPMSIIEEVLRVVAEEGPL